MSHSVLCFACSSELDIDKMYMDNDGNITMEVDPCPDCIKEAGDKGYAECEEKKDDD